jgi:hypothetical protein
MFMYACVFMVEYIEYESSQPVQLHKYVFVLGVFVEVCIHFNRSAVNWNLQIKMKLFSFIRNFCFISASLFVKF